MTTATLGPASLSLPYAFQGLGLAALTAVAAVTFYAYAGVLATMSSGNLQH
jgi:hypothetical protein